MKAVRYALIAIVALIILAVVAVAIAVAVINPNDYKPQIEQAVEDQTNLDLILDGDIGWSFIPLGLELNNVAANLDGERFVALDQLVAQINFWSLLAMSPRVDTFVLNGLDARLEVDKNGTGNWTRIMPEGTEGAEQAGTDDSAGDQAPATDGDSTPLDFNVENIEISNAQVHYDDLSTGQAITLEDFNVKASDIAPGSDFPLDISFRVETTQPQLTVDSSISARLATSKAFDEFSVSGLEALFNMSGDPFGSKSVSARLTGSAKANLSNETATLSDFSASLANLKLNTDLSVQGFGDKPQIKGNINVEEFSLKQLLNSLGQPSIETTDPDVLKALAFATDIGGPAGQVELTGLTLKLDDTSFTGAGSYTLANGAVVFSLTGDKLNVDRYLPPASEGDTVAPEESAQAASGDADPEGDLLPLDTIRSLLLDIDFDLGQLIASNLTITDIKASTTAKSGLVKVDEFSGKLYDGSFAANVTLDARSSNPKWTVKSDVANIETQPLLTDLAEVDMLSGAANLDLSITTTGNRISALRKNAAGLINFNLAEGEFRKINLTHLACEGIAMVNQDELTTTDWGTVTPFNDMHGTLKIDGNTLNNTDLIASLAGMQLEGKGTINLESTTMDYEAGLRIVGEIHRDEACRVTDTVQNVVIPVECRGSFSEDTAGLCSFDGSRFRDTLKDIATNAAKAKAKKEVEKATTKAKEKVSEKLEEELGDKLKGLFN